MNSKVKILDALKLKDEIQAEVLKKTSKLNEQEEVAFYRDAVKDGPFAELLTSLKKANIVKQKRVG